MVNLREKPFYLDDEGVKKKRAHLVFMSSTPTTIAYKGDPVKQVVIEELEAENGANFMNMVKMMDCGKWDTRL